MQLRPLSLNDCEPWAALLAVAFDRASSDMLQLLHWLHAEHELIAWGAWEGTRLIAQYSSLLTALLMPQAASIESVGLSLNMAVHPDYRGRGLIKQLAQPVYAALSDRGGVAGVGFSNAAGVQVDRHSHSYGYRVLGQMQATLVWLLPRDTIEPLCLTSEWPTAPIDFVLPHDDLIRFAASPALVRHRFAQHPFRRYQYGVWEEGGMTRGLVIYCLTYWKRIPIAALLAAYGEDVPALLQRWAVALRRKGIYFAQTLTSPVSPLVTGLRHSGLCIHWPYTRTPYFLTVKPLTAKIDLLLDFKRWDCRGGDIL